MEEDERSFKPSWGGASSSSSAPPPSRLGRGGEDGALPALPSDRLEPGAAPEEGAGVRLEPLSPRAPKMLSLPFQPPKPPGPTLPALSAPLEPLGLKKLELNLSLGEAWPLEAPPSSLDEREFGVPKLSD
ncbi:hypothetical protein IE53DRAFT_74532 [Violaceomyces palustris]|uniref:Uncharacterized protein n=1 Tax=Violaceomyces palustris TaxID=1673888 RepID=A0ACD0NYU4_9BASI|nr:hypothetical protein IE53DRAFT_74532 [Violaceomyces palustris]